MWMFIDSYRFLSSSPDSSVKALVDKSQKTFEVLKEEIDDNGEMLKIVFEIGEGDRTI